jgi:uncharacterized HhH-GPD family protein
MGPWDDRGVTPHLHLSGDPEADALLSAEPLALLIGMILDQQIPLEKAFSSPAVLKERLGGTLDARAIAEMDPEALAASFAERPALHRFPGSMAARVQAACQALVADYGGDAARVWTEAADATELLANVKALPGFGDQKAKIFVALLGKQLGVRPPGWEAASTPYGEPGSFRSVADIHDAASLAQVRAFKAAMKANAGARRAPRAGSPRTATRRG